jgi:alpha-L-rhamnosidase
MDWKGKWIWLEGESESQNFWLCARKAFSVHGDIEQAKLHITADSRYVVWVNGQRIGQGPIRSWPFAYHYDTYDLSHRLRQGENVIAILGLHYGVGTFQYVPEPGGLLAQVELKDKGGNVEYISTDESWRVMEHPSCDRRTPRISCQQAWVEHFDARSEPLGWRDIGFDDSTWDQAMEVGPAGCEPWTGLVPRPIPFLTEEPMYPVSVIRSRLVRPPDQVWAMNLRTNLLSSDIEANPLPLCGFSATTVSVDQETQVTLKHQTSGARARLRVNGKDTERVPDHFSRWGGGNTVTFTLEPGENLLLWDVTGHYHEWSISFPVDAPVHLKPVAPLVENARFVTLGPFESNSVPDFAAVWNAQSAADLEKFSHYARPINPADEYSAQVFDLIASAKPSPGQPQIDDPDALCAVNDDVTTIHPAPDGSDIELVLDFGRMGVGFLEFEMDAPRGVILDWLGFESIQDGEMDYAWGMNNVMRYVTRFGHQRFHSVVRKGGRYFLLTIRNLTAPMRIRQVRSLLNTYPVIHRGQFICNDHLLNQIWRIGRYTTRLCSEDTFVDCPTYEQTFWVGDSRNEGAVNFTAFGEYALSRHCLILAAQSLKRSLLVESQVPSGWENILTAWSLLWVLACEEYYQVTGDMEFLREIYPYVEKQARNCEGMLNPDGLLEIEAWNMLDWAPMDTPGAGIITHQNAWLVEAYRRTARMAEILGHEADAGHYLEVGEKVKSGINKRLWSQEKRAYIDCIRQDGTRSPVVSQQTNTVVFLCDCATEDRREIIRQYISDAPEGFVRVGSPFMMFFTFEALARIGDFQAILDLSRERWGFMLDKDATTCWETFPGFSGGGRWTRSHCHAWSAAPTYFLSAYQLGVRPLEPGFSLALIAPEPADLQWAYGCVPTPEGNISVWWQKGDDFQMEVSLPVGVAAQIQIPVSPEEFPDLKVESSVEFNQSREKEHWMIQVGEGAQIRAIASPSPGV